MTKHELYFTLFINAALSLPQPIDGNRGSQITAFPSPVSQIVTEQGRRGCGGQGSAATSLGRFRPRVISSGGLIKDRTERKMKKWMKELGKVGGGQLVARNIPNAAEV